MAPHFAVASSLAEPRPWLSSVLAIGLVIVVVQLVRTRSRLNRRAKELEQTLANRSAAMQADLARLKQTEEALRESEERWRGALEGSGDGLWDWHIPSNRVHHSSRWKTMLGYAEHEICDGLEEWESRIHPEDIERTKEALQAHFTGRTPAYACEYRLRTKDGSYRWFLDRGQIVSRDKDGQPVRAIGTLADISAQKQTEESLRESRQRLQVTLDNLMEGCQVLSPDWRYVYVNPVCAAQARKPAAEMIGRTMGEVYPGIEATPLFATLQKCMTDRLPAHLENEFRYEDGTSAIFDLEIRPVPDGIFIHSIDVTAQKHAEDAREKLVRLVEHSSDSIITADLEGRLTYINPAGRHLLGLEANADVSHMRLPELESPESAAEFARTVLPAVRSKGVWEGESVFRHRGTGTSIEVSRSAFMVQDPHTKEPVCLATVSREITARKQAERALRESEERFAKVFQASTAIIAISTFPEGKYVDINQAFTDLLGFERDDVLGRRAIDLGIWARPEQRTAIIETLQRGAHVRGVETTIRAKSGRLHTLLASVERIELSGQPCLLFINHDITARKEAEAKMLETQAQFRQLADNLREAFWLLNLEPSQMVYLSPAFEKIWGAQVESLQGQPILWPTSVHGDDQARIANAIVERRRTGEYNVEYRIIRPDGSIRWIHDRAFPVLDSQGRLVRIAGIAEDVTERRQLETQFRQAQKMEALGTLSGGIAHDFNNILGAIFGNVHLARMEMPPGHAASRNLQDIEQAANRAKALVRQILAFSSRQPQARQNTSLGPVVKEVSSLLRATLPAGVQLLVTIDPHAPNVFADPSQIHQVLLNLGTNAWHALAGERGRIEVALEGVEVDRDEVPVGPSLHRGRYARLTVVDNGQGMDPATLERIFEPFFTTKEPGRGTGLGLSVVHGIVQAHDGVIRVTSHPGRGTNFQIYFPGIAASPPEVVKSTRQLTFGAGQRILYLDDEAPLVDLAVRMLRRLRYEPEGFVSPMAAIEAIRENPDRYDLIITDLHMPGLSGIDLIRSVRKIRPDLGFVLSSGYLTEDVMAMARGLGITHLLHKPNSLEDFSDSVYQMLHRRRP